MIWITIFALALLAYIGIHVWLVVVTVRCVIDESKGLRALGTWLTSARSMNRSE